MKMNRHNRLDSMNFEMLDLMERLFTSNLFILWSKKLKSHI